MATTPEFKYAPMFQLGKDDTEYYLLTKDYVETDQPRRDAKELE